MANHKRILIHDDAWKSYRQQLYSFILNQVKDPHAAEDITQDVLLRVYTRLESLASQEKFLPWLYKIARNAISDYYRRSRNEPEVSEALASPEAIEDEKSPYTQLAPCLLPLIQQLPAAYQTALHHAEIENMSQRELAERTGISLPGAKSRVQRGRKILKEMLFQCCQLQLSAAGGLMDFQANSGCKACGQQSSDSCC